jgi:hypothetical protein
MNWIKLERNIEKKVNYFYYTCKHPIFGMVVLQEIQDQQMIFQLPRNTFVLGCALLV